jgi:predicted nucleic acid-binding protein
MNVVDSSAWLEYFADSAQADCFAVAIEDTDSLLVPTICLFEVFKRIHEQRGEDSALLAAAAMRQGQIADLNASLSIQAAKLSRECQLPLADSIILATARDRGATLWTQDSDFEGIEGVQYFARPTPGG